MIKECKGMINIGAPIFQDHSFGKWPNCLPPKSEHNGDPNFYQTTRYPDQIFDMKWNSKNIEDINKQKANGYWDCTAPGYGQYGNYGNGSIFVTGYYSVQRLKLVPMEE
jgi:hypothetical protein